jgi:hypothetical protein
MHCGILGKPHFVPPASKSGTSWRSNSTKFIPSLAINTTRGIVNTKCWLYQPGLVSSVQSHADAMHFGNTLSKATNTALGNVVPTEKFGHPTRSSLFCGSIRGRRTLVKEAEEDMTKRVRVWRHSAST